MKLPHYVPKFNFLFFNPVHGNFCPVSTEKIFGNKKSILLGVPGAFTPTCTNYHLPDFDQRFDELKELGIDQVLAVSVNDGWVLGAWARELELKNVQLLSDGNGEFTEKMNMLVSKKNIHFGWRSWRYTCFINDTKIEKSWVEKGFKNNTMDDPFFESSIDNVIEYLSNENN